MMRLFVPALLVGCATAGNSNVDNLDPDGGVDAPDARVAVDAPMAMPDAAVMMTLTQATSNQNASANSVTCSAGEDSWYRVFALADHGIAGKFTVQSVTFGVQEAGGSPPVQVKIGTYAGNPGTTLNTAMITPINSVTINAANQTNPGANVTVPITGEIPAGSKLIVEIYKPGVNTATTYFYIGASNGGEIKAGYFRAPACSYNLVPIATPTTPGSVGFPTAQLNIVVTGTR
jgi:hypothetical protein